MSAAIPLSDGLSLGDQFGIHIRTGAQAVRALDAVGGSAAVPPGCGWVDRDAPTQPWPTWMQTDEALAGAGELLRRSHDAVANFVPGAPGLRREHDLLGKPENRTFDPTILS
jgi:hypothetical protein